MDGLDRYFVINVDHHLGNAMYGDVNWFDESAAACGEMVADIIDALGVPWTPEIAAHLYLGIATDTGGFRYGPISARTFEICRRIAEAGVDAARALAPDLRQLSASAASGSPARMLERDGAAPRQPPRRAVLRRRAARARAARRIDDTEGLVNLPLGAREVLAVALFKRQSDDTYRVSLRSKGDVDVRERRRALGRRRPQERGRLHDRRRRLRGELEGRRSSRAIDARRSTLTARS